MKIQVTADDIANGVAKKCEYCPVARAVSRAMGYSCSVGYTGIWKTESRSIAKFPAIWKTGNPGGTIAKFTEVVGMWIKDFDCGRPVQPFEFELELIG